MVDSSALRRSGSPPHALQTLSRVRLATSPDKITRLAAFLVHSVSPLLVACASGGPLLFPSSLLASRHFASLDPRRGCFHGSWGFVLRAPALGFVLPLGLLFAARLCGAPWFSWGEVARSVALRARPRSSCRVSCRVFCACDRPCPLSSGWRRRARGVDRVTLAAAVCEPPRLVARGICFGC